jgi:hypothetical protein
MRVRLPPSCRRVLYSLQFTVSLLCCNYLASFPCCTDRHASYPLKLTASSRNLLSGIYAQIASVLS